MSLSNHKQDYLLTHRNILTPSAVAGAVYAAINMLVAALLGSLSREQADP